MAFGEYWDTCEYTDGVLNYNQVISSVIHNQTATATRGGYLTVFERVLCAHARHDSGYLSTGGDAWWGLDIALHMNSAGRYLILQLCRAICRMVTVSAL